MNVNIQLVQELSTSLELGNRYELVSACASAGWRGGLVSFLWVAALRLFLDALATRQGTVPLHCRSINLRSLTPIDGFPLITVTCFP
jgi:hypothetical protein